MIEMGWLGMYSARPVISGLALILFNTDFLSYWFILKR